MPESVERPVRFVPSYAIHHVHYSDNGTPYSCWSKRGVVIYTRRSTVNEKRPAVMRLPSAILNVFAAEQDMPSPRAANSHGFHVQSVSAQVTT